MYTTYGSVKLEPPQPKAYEIASRLSGQSVNNSLSTLAGYSLTWSFDQKVTFGSILTALRAAEIDPKYLKELDAKAIFSKAKRRMLKERTIDIVTDEGRYTVFQLTKKHCTSDGDKPLMEYVYECQITLDTDTGYISCPEDYDIQARARELFDEAGTTRGDSEISKMLIAYLETEADIHAWNKKKGVVYFVPARYETVVGKLELFFESLNVPFAPLPVFFGSERGNKAMQIAVSSTITKLVADLNECVEGWDEHTRDDTIRRKIKLWRELEHKTLGLGDYLQAERDTMMKLLADAKVSMIERISDLRPE